MGPCGWAMETDGPVDGCPMETGRPVHGVQWRRMGRWMVCPMQMDGPRKGGQWKRMGR